jgi:hypothetical protein
MAIEINKFSTKSSDTLPCYDTAGGNESHAYIYVDVSDREMWVSYKLGHDNSWGIREDRRYVHTFRVANNLTAEGYNDLLSRPGLAHLVEQLINECEEYYDGSNYRMRVSERGQEVIEAIERYCEDTSDCESLDPWCADMYLQHVTYQDLTATGGTHEEIAERIVIEARKNGIHLSAVDVESRLDEMQEEAAED